MNPNTTIVLLLIIIVTTNVNKKILYIMSIGVILYFLYRIYINNNVIQNKKINYSDEAEKILKKIKKYSKYNENDYSIGLKYIDYYFKNIETLQKDKLEHYQQFIDNTIYYLDKSINHFQYITVSVPDYKSIEQLKYNDFKSIKKASKLSKLIKNLYKHCYGILNSVIEKHNYKYINNPVNYNFIINNNQPKGYNGTDSYELY